MEQLSFTANRFKNTDKIINDKSNDQNNDLINKNIISSPDSSDLSSYNNSVLIDSTHYSLINEYQKIPDLKEDETILSFNITIDNIAIIITNSRILIYNYKSFEKRPYCFQFQYKQNVYNILPLVLVISNPINPLKPDLIIVDSITGKLTFFESIKLLPSLSVLQNTLENKISLYNSEFLTNIQTFEDNSLLLTTSQKRIIHVTFKDQFGNIIINSNQIFNNRPLISFMLSKSYNIKEYENSNHITSIKYIDLSPVSKIIIILESSGHISFINHLKGSSTFILDSKFDLDLIISNNDLKFLDFQFISSKKIGIFLTFDTIKKSFQNLLFDFSNLKSIPSLIFNSKIHLLSSNEVINNPKIFLLNNENTILFQNNYKLIIFDINLNQLSNPWTEVIILNSNLKLYSIVKLNKSNDLIELSTNKGLLSFKFKSSGKSNDIISYLKDHLIQYLKYSNENSLIVFNLKDTLLPIIENDEKIVINNILDELLNDTSNLVNHTESNINNILINKVNLIKKLIIYVSKNYKINQDDELKIKLLNTCELFSLTEKFYQLIINENLIQPVIEILKEDNIPFNVFFQKHSSKILFLISKYIESAKNVGNEVQIKNLASFLSTLFIEAFIKLDDKIKQYLNGIGLSTVFIEHFDLIKNIDEITRMVYNLELSHDEMVLKYGEILIGLSCFLYYSINEIVLYLESHNSTNKFDSLLLKFSNLLRDHKDKWIHIFIVLQKQDDIIPLVNKYLDYPSLAALLESKREIIQNLYSNKEISDIEFTNFSTDIEIEFDNYFDRYNYLFAEALFDYYIQNNKINIMLSCFEKHSEYLDKYLASDIKYYKFAWINDIKYKRFDKVSCQMLNYISISSSNPIKNFKLQSSIAKLSTLCLNSNEYESKIFNYQICNGYLSLVSLQEFIKTKLTDIGCFLKNYDPKILTNEKYLNSNNFSYFPNEIQHIFQKLSSDISLNITEIITFITLSNFKVFSRDKIDNVETNIDDHTNDSDEMKTTVVDDFKINTFIKILHFLEDQTFIKTDNIIFSTLSNSIHNSEKQKSILIKILIRRLVIHPYWKKFSNKIYGMIVNENIKFYSNENDLILKANELKEVGISDTRAYSDYELENKLLTTV